MENTSTSPMSAELPLPLESQARLDQFKAFAARHPLLDQVEAQLLQAIWEPAGFAYLLVYGPSGVGKSTLVRHTTRRFNDSLQARPDGAGTCGPLLLMETRPPDGALFNRTDYYRTALEQLGRRTFERRITVDISAEQSWEKKGAGRKSARYQDDPELRHALEDTLRKQNIRAVILDEAQHLMKTSNGASLLEQLDWIKSMTNVTGVLHILLGTYDLLNFCNLNGQTARRGLEIHFPRYHFQSEPDRQAFQNVLLTLLKQVPLSVDEEVLMQRWGYFYERSIGCVGVLKDWLTRAAATALREGSTALTLAHLEKRALSDAKCARMAADARDGEDELHYTQEHRERLLSLLGMSGLPMKTLKQAAESEPTSSSTLVLRTEPPRKTSKERVGERAPERAPVGETKPEAKPAKCSLVGAIDLAPDDITRTGISKVQCPDCGAMRAVRVQRNTVMFPSHPRRLTSTPPRDVRWMKEGTTWTLSEKNR
jgi:energy-coupling factor transporter ATP-binding protein EcfA2